MKRGLLRTGIVLSAVAIAAPANLPAGADVRGSVVKILSTQRVPDLLRPWTKAGPQEMSGSGVVIDGKRILTNAHVVRYASQVYVQGHQSADKIAAKTIGIATGIDLAVLELEDESFFDSRPAVPFAEKLPTVRDTVNVYGYPMGGSELSVTEGIVSRIEFTAYSFDTMGLRIQVDAALNFGNSGGPAIMDDKIVGLVFSGIRFADNIGYLIPVEEIQTFLADIADGEYTGKPALFDEFQTLENDAVRAKLGLDKSTTGLMVTNPDPDEESNPLQRWDVLTHIGEHDIDNEGKVRVNSDLRLDFHYLISKVVRDGKLPLKLLRNGQPLSVDAPVRGDRNYVVRVLTTNYPRYFIYGPLTFSTLTQGFIQRMGGRLRSAIASSPLITRQFDKAEFEGEELVVVTSRMFPHRITKAYDDPFGRVIESVNDVKIKNLKHLVETLRDVKDEYVIFKFAGTAQEILVFKRSDIERISEDILTDNGIRYRCSKDLREVWPEGR